MKMPMKRKRNENTTQRVAKEILRSTVQTSAALANVYIKYVKYRAF